MTRTADALRARADDLRRLASRIDAAEVMVMNVAPGPTTWQGPAQAATHLRLGQLVAELAAQVARLRDRARRLELDADEFDRQALLVAQHAPSTDVADVADVDRGVADLARYPTGSNDSARSTGGRWR